MIEKIETTDRFESLKDEWERIEENPDLRIFQTYSWCKSAWDCCVSAEKGARLWILRWSQEGKSDTVIFPFYIDASRRLRFIMDAHSDFCDSVHGPEANRHWAYKEAAEAILAEKSVKSVFLQKMRGGSEALNYLSILLPGGVVAKDNSFSWIRAAKTGDFLGGQPQFKRKDRDRIKALLRKSADLDFEILSPARGDAFPEASALALRGAMVGWRRSDDSFLSDAMLSFIKNIYEAGKCEVARFSAGGEAKALAFRLLKGVRAGFWIVLYDDPKLVTALYVRYMQAKAAESDCVFDFGVGAYDYKLGTYRPELGVTFSLRYARGLARHLLGLAAANVRLLKDLLKPRLKEKRREPHHG